LVYELTQKTQSNWDKKKINSMKITIQKLQNPTTEIGCLPPFLMTTNTPMVDGMTDASHEGWDQTDCSAFIQRFHVVHLKCHFEGGKKSWCKICPRCSYKFWSKEVGGRQSQFASASSSTAPNFNFNQFRQGGANQFNACSNPGFNQFPPRANRRASRGRRGSQNSDASDDVPGSSYNAS
jgi:hypothetical protein